LTATSRGRQAAGLSFRPLRHRQFAVVWSAALISNAGTWMQTVAVGALVTETTGQAGWTGLVAAAAFVPNGLIGPIGGALADRFDRRMLLFGTTVFEAVLATLLTILYATGNTTPGVVSLVVLAAGVAGGIGFPCYQSMMPDLVDREDLLGAIALSAAQWNFGRVIGPALAGLVIHFGSYGWAFAVNAVSFAAPAVAMLVVRVPSPRTGAGSTIRAQIREGVETVRADAGTRSIFGLIATVSVCAAPFIALVPAMAIIVYDGDAGTTALLVTAQGVGAVLGALGATPLAERFGRERLLRTWLFALPAALCAYAVAPTLALGAVALAAVGFVYLGVFAGLNVALQLRTPDVVRGRVVSLYFAVLGIVYPLASLLQGWLGDRIGLRQVTAAGGLLFLAILVARKDRLLGKLIG
jgi:MFS family permease